VVRYCAVSADPAEGIRAVWHRGPKAAEPGGEPVPAGTRPEKENEEINETI
jgi:hypothetical protein